MRNVLCVFLVGVLALGPLACSSMNKTEKGAVIGGAIAGPPGAVVGGAVGAAGGAGVGDKTEEDLEEGRRPDLDPR